MSAAQRLDITGRSPVSLKTIKSLSARSDRCGLLQCAGHFGAIALAMGFVLSTRGTLASVPGIAMLGVLEVALFAPLHESTHRTPFRSLWLNRAIGWLAGFVLILPPEGFRLFHMAHHRHTQDPERDPELLGESPLTFGRYLWLLTGLPYWAAQIRGLLVTAGGRLEAPWIPATARATVILEARFYLGLYALSIVLSWWLASTFLVMLWVLPVLVGQPVLRAVLMAEHKGCPRSDDRLANTRTTLANRAFGLLFWNANLHVEHHLAPGVPFHALPKLHALLRPYLKSLDPSYPAAHRGIIKTLRPSGAEEHDLIL